MSENGNYRLHAFVKGRVQGVGFRYHTLQAAQDHSLKGWVRNLRDGRVEVIAEGEHEVLNKFLMSVRKGPMSAVVEDVDYEFKESLGDFNQFFVRATE